MTEYKEVYEPFLARILEEEWENWLIEEAEQDWRQLLEMAIPWFKFPRQSLAHDDSGFSGNLDSEEKQIIANYMVYEWTQRCILTYDNIKALYEEKDFSQANLLDKLNQTAEAAFNKAQDLERVYYRSRKGKPFQFSKLATNLNDVDS